MTRTNNVHNTRKIKNSIGLVLTKSVAISLEEDFLKCILLNIY